MKVLTGRRRSGPPWPWLLLLFSLCCPIPSILSQERIPPYAGEISCIQFGQGPDGGPFTIGGKTFRPRDVYPSRYSKVPGTGGSKTFKYSKSNRDTEWWEWPICPKGHEWYEGQGDFYVQDLCPKDLELRAYVVRQKERVLRGWLHFEVELKDDEIQYINFQVKDEQLNTIGEFVTKEEEQCKPSKKGLISPTPYQILPCSAIGQREATVGQALFMVHPDQLADPEGVDPKFLPKEELKRGVAFNWRLNEYWCNRHAAIRVDVEVWTKKNERNFEAANRLNRNRNPPLPDSYCDQDHSRGCRLYRKVSQFYLYLKWYGGAADIRLDGAGELDCTTPAVDYSNGALTQEATEWLDSAWETVVRDDFYTGKFGNNQFEDHNHIHRAPCQVDVLPRGSGTTAGIVTFGGRCKKVRKTKEVAHSNYQKCDLWNENFEGVDTTKFKPYKEYASKLTEDRLRVCEQKCVAPDIDNPEHLEEIKKFPKENVAGSGRTESGTNSAEPERNTLAILGKVIRARAEERRIKFWLTRQFHGMTCIFIAMFLLPLSNFLARYYKETFTNADEIGCKPWLGFHLLVCLLTPSLLLATVLPMWYISDTFGRSESSHGTSHCQIGYAFLGVFMLMVCIGGFRPLKRLPRLVCMALHSVVGYVLQVGALILIYQSSYIPGSPSLDECEPDSQLPIGLSFVAQMALVRIGMDVLFHTFLTCFQKAVDKKHEIRRHGFGLPIVPFLPGTTRKDLEGSRIRKAVLVVYLVLSFGVTFLAILDLWEKEDNPNCSLGELSCDMSQTLPNKASSPFGCSSTSLKYYAKMLKEYNIDPTLGV